MKTVIKIPSTAVLVSNEIWDSENGTRCHELLMELPPMLLNKSAREQIQRTIDAGKFEITVYK